MQVTEELKDIKLVDWQRWFIASKVRRHTAKRRAQELLNQANLAEGMRALDLGCAFGYTSCLMAKKGARIFGVDIYEPLLEVGLKLAEANQLKVNFVRANAKRLPFPDGTFNIVICSELIEHVIDWRKVVKEMARVVKADGQVVISTPNIRGLAVVKPMLIKCHLLSASGYECFLPPWKIRKELERNGLRVKRERTVTFALSYSPDCLYRLSLWLERTTRLLERKCGGTIIFSCQRVGSISEELPDEPESLDSVLACPLCLGRVKEEGEKIICLNCFKEYPIRKGIPIMVAEEGEAKDWADLTRVRKRRS